MSAHTPTPWKVAEDWRDEIHGADGTAICFNDLESRGPGPVDAAFIVRACNAHDELVAALRAIIDFDDGDQSFPSEFYELLDKARAALAKAEAPGVDPKWGVIGPDGDGAK